MDDVLDMGRKCSRKLCFLLTSTSCFLFIIFCFLLFSKHSSAQWSDNTLKKISNNKIIYNYLHLSYSYLIKNSDTAKLYANKAFREAFKEKNMPATSLAYAFLAHTELQTGNYLKAIEFLDFASSINNNLNIPELDAYIKYVTATKFSVLNRTKEAIEETTRALSIYEQIKDTSGIASLYKFIGILYLQSGGHDDLVKAQLYFAKTLDIHTRLKDYSRVGSDLSLMGSAYIRLKQYDSAHRCLLQAIDFNRKSNNSRWLATDYLRLGELKSDIIQYDSAIYYFNKAEDEYIKLGQLKNVIFVIIEKGRIAKQQQQFTKARSFFYEAYNLADSYKMTDQKIDAIQGLHETAEAVGDFKNAYSLLLEYSQLRDSNIKIKNLPIISLIEIQRDFEFKKRKIQLDNEKIGFESRRKSIYIILLVIFSIILIAMFLLVYYSLKLRQRAFHLEKEELNQDIEFKNKELMTNIMSLMKKNEILVEISQKLMKMEGEEINDESKSKLKRIAKEVQDKAGSEIWEEFDLRVKQVHSGFYKNLLENFPTLTPGEMRLCAFLRLNLSTKDISQLTGQNIRAIEMTRFRLRKKLAITDPEVNLVTYLSKL